MPNITNITSPRVPFIDEKTGLISREWYRFLLNLFYLTGSGANDVTLVDLQLTPSESAIDARIDELQKQIDGAYAEIARLSNGEISKDVDALSLSPAIQSNNSVSTDYIDIDVSPPPPTYKVGRLWWDVNGTLNIGMGNGNITQQVGDEVYTYGKASAAISDTNLQLVYKTGSVGASGAIQFAPVVAGITDADKIVGIATEPIANNAFGRVTIIGYVNGINTSGSAYGETWADDDDIWYNPTTGGLTKTMPTAPLMKCQVGTVIRAGSGGSGVFRVKIGDSTTMPKLSDVNIASIADKQVLQYSATNQRWENVSAAGVVAAETHAATSKTTPVDADELPLADSASSFSLKKLTWANLKATLATWIGGNLIAGSFTSLISSTTIKAATTVGVGNATPSTSGSGITFPATQSASTNANTLDDYEEGTWTPAITFGTTNSGTTYSAQVGRYTKIGNRVFYTGIVTLSSKGTSTGVMSITGLPFSVNASSSNLVPASARFQSLASGVAHYSASLPVSSSQIYLEKFSSGSTNFLVDTDATNTSSFSVSGQYET